MSLQHELDALRAEFVRTAPPGRAALYDAKVKELQRTFAVGKIPEDRRFRTRFQPAESIPPLYLACGCCTAVRRW
jgi:hypothetical protein